MRSAFLQAVTNHDIRAELLHLSATCNPDESGQLEHFRTLASTQTSRKHKNFLKYDCLVEAVNGCNELMIRELISDKLSYSSCTALSQCTSTDGIYLAMKIMVSKYNENEPATKQTDSDALKWMYSTMPLSMTKECLIALFKYFKERGAIFNNRCSGFYITAYEYKMFDLLYGLFSLPETEFEPMQKSVILKQLFDKMERETDKRQYNRFLPLLLKSSAPMHANVVRTLNVDLNPWVFAGNLAHRAHIDPIEHDADGAQDTVHDGMYDNYADIFASIMDDDRGQIRSFLFNLATVVHLQRGKNVAAKSFLDLVLRDKDSTSWLREFGKGYDSFLIAFNDCCKVDDLARLVLGYLVGED